MRDALRHHWPEYLIEAAGLGAFMISACACAAILDYPGSPIHRALPDPVLRRLLFGLAMGLTAISIIYSPWGKLSGAHINPCVTLTFFRLGKVHRWDACFYVVAQLAGGIAGVMLSATVLGEIIAHPSVNYVVTTPGVLGPGVAFAAEALISFGLMSVVLIVSNIERIARFTGVFAGALVATYITFEAPLSGMSMNPARTFASAFGAHLWTALWIYFTAPPLGMLLAAQLHLRLSDGVGCAKLHHQNALRCIFCEYRLSREPTVVSREQEGPLHSGGSSLA